jgi:PPOX class probable F420-dependent enzyme
MARLTDAHRAFLENPYFGTVTTLREDGSPHNTVVWVDVDGDTVVFNTAEGRAKPEHLRNDARAALTVIDPQNGHKWISVSGPAELTHEGADEQIDKLAKKYLGADSYPHRRQGEQRVNVRIRAEHIDSAGLDG